MSRQITATCHCGATALSATLPNDLKDASRCTCSFCKRRQAAAVTATTSSVKVTKGRTTYRFTAGVPTQRNIISVKPAVFICTTNADLIPRNAESIWAVLRV
jgi:hypothetical protein